MKPEQASELVARMAANWSPPAWSSVKFALFADALRPLPYGLTRKHIDVLIDTRPREKPPVVADITRHVWQVIQRINEKRALTKMLPDCSERESVKQFLRDTIERLERKVYGPVLGNGGGALLHPSSPHHTLSGAEIHERRKLLANQRQLLLLEGK